MTIRVALGVADLARVRFAISPVAETMCSLMLLHDDPGSVDLHRPWRRTVGAALSGRDRELLLSLVPAPGICLPGYLTPIPSSTRPTIERQLATVRATGADAVRADLLRAYGDDDIPPAYDEWYGREVDDLLDGTTKTLGRYWQEAISPHWTVIREVLEADLTYRARTLAESGFEGVIATLHPRLRYDGEALCIDDNATAVTETRARGLVLTPSVFQWPRLTVGQTPNGPLVVVYPARGVGELWSPRVSPAEDTLAKLFGDARAQLLADLGEPRSTTELAGRHGFSQSTVSYHLTTLHDGGLLERRRAGHRVLYRRSHLGNLLFWRSTGRHPESP